MLSDWQARARDFLMEHAARGDLRAAEIVREQLLAERARDAQEVAPAMRAIIGVCTAMRPILLIHCLDAIGAQIVPPGVEVHVVVVDNEAAPNNRRLVQAFASRCPFPVHYIHEARRGISQARNAILKQGRTLGAGWIAMTDDDCWVSPTWLGDLLEAAARHKTDVVYGRRELLSPLPSLGALPEPASRAGEGQVLPYAATHNVLMAAWLIHSDDRHGSNHGGLDFDERLARGEDRDFFHRAARRGARIVFSRKPVVFRTVSPERTTLTYQTRRAHYYAASHSYFHRRHKDVRRAAERLATRWMLQAPAAVLRLAFAVGVAVSEVVFSDLVGRSHER